MKPVSTILVSVGFVCAAAGAQSNDTSILKNGNTWLYTRQNESYAPNLYDGSSGTVRFTIDSLIRVQDTVKFKVIRRDVGLYLIWPVGSDSAFDTTQTTKFTFRNGAYSPSIPFFANGQSFQANASRVVFRNDTLRTRDSVVNANPAGGVYCMRLHYYNVEKIGRVTNNNDHGPCGIDRGKDWYQLKEFNGWTYSSDSISPVGILKGRQTLSKPAPMLSIGNGQILFRKDSRAYDLKGQKAGAEAVKKTP